MPRSPSSPSTSLRLDADAGAVDESTLAAVSPVTFGHAKRSFFLFPAPIAPGRIFVADIGLPEDLDDDIATEVLDEHSVARTHALNAVQRLSHPSFGKFLILSGRFYVGPAASRLPGAQPAPVPSWVALAGAGTLARSGLPVDRVAQLVLRRPAAGFRPGTVTLVARSAEGCGTVAVGPSLGQAAASGVETIHAILFSPAKVLRPILDADALNALALTRPGGRFASFCTILIPHPGEMARLTA